MRTAFSGSDCHRLVVPASAKLLCGMPAPQGPKGRWVSDEDAAGSVAVHRRPVVRVHGNDDGMTGVDFRLVVRPNQADDDLYDEDHENNHSDRVRGLAYIGCGVSHLRQGRVKVRGLVTHGGAPGIRARD